MAYSKIKTFIILSGCLVAAGCSSPRQQCINNATYQLRQIENLAGTTAQNIQRGYAIHESSVPYTENKVCSYNDPSRNYQVTQYACPETSTRKQETPVSIAMNAERYKFQQLSLQYQQLKPISDRNVQACIAQYPAK